MLTCTYKGCYRWGYGGSDKCIFHAEKKDPQEFRNALAAQIRQWRSEKAERWDFSGWVFVDAPRPKSNVLNPNLFRRGVFQKRALFDDAKFLCKVDFTFARFTEGAQFERVRFQKTSLFTKARFSGSADFSNGEFTGDAGFDGTDFGLVTIFSEVKFHEMANFAECQFANGVSFCAAEFRKDGIFSEASFFKSRYSVPVSFEHAAFIGDAVFYGSQWWTHADFSYAYFERSANFNNASINAEVRFSWPGVGLTCDEEGNPVQPGTLDLNDMRFPIQESGLCGILDLRDNDLRDGANLKTRDMDVRSILLAGTDCRLIEFRKVTWPRWKGRQVVGDEYIARTRPEFYAGAFDWDSIAITYQELTDRFRKDLNHPVANDFERGIFESRLMGAKQKDERGKRAWRTVVLLSLYKAASNFSGSIMRPFWWALAVTVAAALIYGGLLYDGFGSMSWWCKGIVASLRMMNLDRHWFSIAVDASDVGDFGRFILTFTAVIQTLLTATLATLFIFSVRRRFKHTE
jgi:uncharacterized protein YjbI with pentapeptide repeats